MRVLVLISQHCAQQMTGDTASENLKSRIRIQTMLRHVTFAAFFGVIVCISEIYELFGPHGIFSPKDYADSVEWFVQQTVQR